MVVLCWQPQRRVGPLTYQPVDKWEFPCSYMYVDICLNIWSRQNFWNIYYVVVMETLEVGQQENRNMLFYLYSFGDKKERCWLPYWNIIFTI